MVDLPWSGLLDKANGLVGPGEDVPIGNVPCLAMSDLGPFLMALPLYPGISPV